MQNEESIEKLDIIDDGNLTVLSPLPSKQWNAYRIRKILLILLSILFVFDLIYLIFIVHAYIDHSLLNHYFKNNYELLWTLGAVIYDAFGLLVIYRYYRIGLLVFASIGTIFLVFACVLTGIILITAFFATKSASTVHVGIIGPLIFLIIFIASTIFLLIIVLLSFKLSKLIVNNRDTTNQSI